MYLCIYIYIYIHTYIYIYIWNLNFIENFISKSWVYIKTCSFYVYTLDCNVSWIYKQRLASKHKLFSLSKLYFSTILPASPFWRKMYPPPLFDEEKELQSPSLLWWGDPAMINQNYSFHLLVTKNRSSNNKNIEFQIWECFIH